MPTLTLTSWSHIAERWLGFNPAWFSLLCHLSHQDLHSRQKAGSDQLRTPGNVLNRSNRKRWFLCKPSSPNTSPCTGNQSHSLALLLACSPRQSPHLTQLQLPPTWVCATGFWAAFQPKVSLHHRRLIFLGRTTSAAHGLAVSSLNLLSRL